MKNCSIVLAGIGGYGLNYLRALLDHGREHSAGESICDLRH